MIKAIWIDPGENVGWATSEVPDLGPEHRLEILDYGNALLRPFAHKLLRVAADYDLIGFETYALTGDPKKLRAQIGSTIPTLQLVGMIRQAAWEAQERRGDGFPRIVEQPNTAKTKGLGALRLWLPDYLDIVQEALDGPHDDGHFGDALLHTAAWYQTEIIEGRML